MDYSVFEIYSYNVTVGFSVYAECILKKIIIRCISPYNVIEISKKNEKPLYIGKKKSLRTAFVLLYEFVIFVNVELNLRSIIYVS